MKQNSITTLIKIEKHKIQNLKLEIMHRQTQLFTLENKLKSLNEEAGKISLVDINKLQWKIHISQKITDIQKELLLEKKKLNQTIQDYKKSIVQQNMYNKFVTSSK